MSGSLLEIKKKIGGVKNTRKITKAMQLVAASKMRQFQKRAVGARSYVWDLFTLLQNNSDAQTRSLYTEKREEGATLFVLYTSDKGLCGALNNKLINGLFRSTEWKETPEAERKLITIGRKAEEFAKNNGIPVMHSFSGLPEKITTLDALNVVDKILDVWRAGDVSQVKFVAPHYKNSFTFYPVIKTFLPISLDVVEDSLGHLEDDERPEVLKRDNQFMIFTPSEEVVLERLYEQIVQAIFLQSFLELKASEYSSRMIAMQNATDSADRMINDLTLVLNKARQAAITQEIAELIGASMALADEE